MTFEGARKTSKKRPKGKSTHRRSKPRHANLGSNLAVPHNRTSGVRKFDAAEIPAGMTQSKVENEP